MLKISSMHRNKEKKYVIVKVRFQSHVNMRKMLFRHVRKYQTHFRGFVQTDPFFEALCKLTQVSSNILVL